MIIYRALTEEDLNELKETGTIQCTLNRKFDYAMSDKEDLLGINEFLAILNNYTISHESGNDYKTRFIMGHVGGQLCEAGRSPWISLTLDYEVAIKYADLKKCAYGIGRKTVIAFEFDESLVFSKASDFLNIIKENTIISLTEGKLLEYLNNGIMLSHTGGKKMNKCGFSNFSYSDSELLCYSELKKNNYVLLDPSKRDQLKIKKINIEEYIKDELKNSKQKQFVKF